MVRKAEDEYITDRYNQPLDQYELAWRPVVIFGRKNINPPKKVNDVDKLKRAIHAEVNDGRWVGRCTKESCGGAQIVSPADQRYFCPYCLNEEANGNWLRVHFPEDWEEREKVLDRRPMRNQHMKSGETLKELQAENKLRGL